ncbi:hypothetical protein IKD67_00820 [Candidatus Saccharibacteria bacterium]|nr:hypothetical protein [Candidatus Saccharibacteria bacterium]
MQMMIEGAKKSANNTMTKKWLREAALETFTAKELEKMADQKRKKGSNKTVKKGIPCGLPEDYDKM